MDTRISIAKQVRPRLSLPPRVAALAARVSTTLHPGEIRYSIPAPLDLEDRAEATRQLSILNRVLEPTAMFGGHTAEDAKLAIVTMMILGLAGPAMTIEEVQNARFDLYDMALERVPAWAIAEAVGRWVRRECPAEIEKGPNYAFPPCPATLGALARIELKAFERARDSIDHLLAAVSAEEALLPSKRDFPYEIGSRPPLPRLRKM